MSDDEPTDVLPRVHACCGEKIRMQEIVFGEHTCPQTLRSVAMAVREILEWRTENDAD